MRYYSISIDGLDPSIWPPVPGASMQGAQWDTLVSGVNDPGAQDVTMHLEANMMSSGTSSKVPTTSNDSVLEIRGVSWDQIKNTNQLIGKHILIAGGMSPGLPLATYQSQFAGKLITGRIVRAWGNWVGTEMSIGINIGTDLPSEADTSSNTNTNTGSGTGTKTDTGGGANPTVATSGDLNRYRSQRYGPRSLTQRGFARGISGDLRASQLDLSPNTGLSLGSFFATAESALASAVSNIGGGLVSNFVGGGTPGLSMPLNIIHNLQPNMALSDAIQQTISTLFPTMPIQIAISSMLKLPYQDAGVYQNMQQYAKYIHDLSHSIMGFQNNYLGVLMSAHCGIFRVWDNTSPGTTRNIQALELIGQPTWVDQALVHIQTVMRADIKPGDNVTLPPGTLMSVQADAINPNPDVPQVSHVSLEGQSFHVINILHIGELRNPDGVTWCSIYRCYPNASGVQTTAVPASAQPTTQIPGSQPTTPNQQTQFGSLIKRNVRGRF